MKEPANNNQEKLNIEKRQPNPNASGEEGLLHSPQVLAFHVDPLATKPWMSRLQDSVAD